MSRDVGKGLDPKRETSCTAGDELCRGRRGILRETRCAAGDESCHGRRDVPREMSHAAGDEVCHGRRDVPRETGRKWKAHRKERDQG